MGEFKAGGWIVGLLIYFFLLFTFTSSVINAKASYGVHESRVDLDATGFETAESNFRVASCGGVMDAMGIFGIVRCKDTQVTNEEECNDVNGCQWENATSLFNFTISPAFCDDDNRRDGVNQTFYGFNGTNKNTACASLGNESNCNLFGCVWLNETTSFMEVREFNNFGTNAKFTTVWETIKFMAGFNIDLGLGQFTFMFSFLFFWIPMVMLLLSVWFSLPFAH